MPKVLVVGQDFNASPAYMCALLRNLGIQYDIAIGHSTASGAPLHTPVGVLNASSTACRNFLRQYDAVIITRNDFRLDSTGNIRIAGFWLSWNDPEDPPIVYLGWNFSTLATQLDSLLPADFPLIRPNPTHLADTVAIADNAQPIHSSSRRPGTVAYLQREQATIYSASICTHHSDGRGAYWRYDPAKHATLADQPYTHRIALNGRAGEILATPAPMPDETYPSNTVIGYRYKNCLFLPIFRAFGSFTAVYAPNNIPDAFWALYALKCAGVRPAWQLPVFFETDHPIELGRGRVDGLSFEAQMRAETALLDYMRDFARRTGMVVVHGLLTGSMARPVSDINTSAHHWSLVHATRFGGTPALETESRRAHDLLLTGHREGVAMCGIHDHTVSGGWWATVNYANFRRHSRTQYDSPYSPPNLSFPLEAPNPVRIQKGRCCVRQENSPVQAGQGDAVELQIGDATYVEWNYPDGSLVDIAGTFTMPADSLQAARLVIESSMAEMRALGFSDGHCGEHRYTNTAQNYSGGPAYWQAALEYGFRALRSQYLCNESAAAHRNTVPTNYRWGRMWLIRRTEAIDWASGGQGAHGLYYPSAPSSFHCVGDWGLDYNGDITSDYPNTAWRAHRRAVVEGVKRWLSGVVDLCTAYGHPVSMLGYSETQPLARFDGVLEYRPNLPHWNGLVEIFEAMHTIVQTLSDYLHFGSVSDLIAVRERVMLGQ